MGLVLALAPQFCPALRCVRKRNYRITVGMRLVGLVESVGLKLELKLVSAPDPQSGPAPALRINPYLLRAAGSRLVLRPRLVLGRLHPGTGSAAVLDRPRYWIGLVRDRLHPAGVRAVRRRADRKLRHGHVRRAGGALPVPPGSTSGGSAD